MSLLHMGFWVSGHCLAVRPVHTTSSSLQSTLVLQPGLGPLRSLAPAAQSNWTPLDGCVVGGRTSPPLAEEGTPGHPQPGSPVKSDGV